MSTYISRKGHCQVGWRLPRALVQQVKEICKKENLQPSQFLERAIRRPFGQEKIYTASELERIVRHPAHLQPPKERLVPSSKIA
jgi:hypothetical protein